MMASPFPASPLPITLPILQHGNASVICGSRWGITIAALRAKFPAFEARSTSNLLPTADTVIQWGKDVLDLA